MKRLLPILTLLFPVFICAQDIIIDERITDIYYANGIMNTKDQAWESSKLIKSNALRDIYNNDTAALKRETDYKLLYNDTNGLLGDLLEAFEQKQLDHQWFWATLEIIYDVSCDYLTGGKLKDIVKGVIVDLIIDLIVDPLQEALEITFLDELISIIVSIVTLDVCGVPDIPRFFIALLHDKDFRVQLKDVRESIQSGHHATIVAHSQGNLFFNEVYTALYNNDIWMTNYVNVISVASPSDDVLDKATPVIFDNDPIVYVWGKENGIIENPLREVEIKDDDRYEGQTPPCAEGIYFRDDANLSACLQQYDLKADYNLTSLTFHAFEYYMSPTLSANGVEKPNPSHNIIIEALKTYLQNAKQDLSQWDIKKGGNCNAVSTCPARLKYVKHAYEESMNEYMDKILVYPFYKAHSGKIYPIDRRTEYGKFDYVKAKSPFGNEIISLDPPYASEDTICYELQDENKKTLELLIRVKVKLV